MAKFGLICGFLGGSEDGGLMLIAGRFYHNAFLAVNTNLTIH